jgi:hypothetical protein
VAFEGLLTRGEHFANRITGAFADDRDWPQLIHIATDGESYGHHHRFGDMALSYALNYIESNQLARLTNYGEYLEKHLPTHQVEIIEKSSWSCAHGIDRWWSNCGCNSGGHPGWNQEWRTPLRNALDWLRDSLAYPYEEMGRRFFKDPWTARNEYIDVILDRSPKKVDEFLARQAVRELGESDRTSALKLLELQRHTLLMYTSCGWFFDELSGIETVQVIQYAGRAVQLAQVLFGNSHEAQFVERLEQAKSNIPDQGNGRRIYEKFVTPAIIDWERIGAHYAISSLFGSYPEQTRIYCFTAEREDYQIFEAGKAKMAIGRVKLTSEITGESSALSFGVIHFGDHNLNGGVRKFLGDDAYRALAEEVTEPFARADFPEVIRIMDRRFGESSYSLRSLFRDEQRKILNVILASTLEEAEALYRQHYENHAPMMRFLTDLHIPLPKAFHAAAEFVLNGHLRRALESDEIDTERIGVLLQTAKVEGVALDTATLEFAFRHTIERLAERLAAEPTGLPALQNLDAAASLLPGLPFGVDLWKIQNIYYRILRNEYVAARKMKDAGDESAKAWVDGFEALGQKLEVKTAKEGG